MKSVAASVFGGVSALFIGCAGNTGVVEDSCQWERVLYENSREIIARDSASIAKYGYSTQEMPLLVSDSAVFFGIDYGDFDIDREFENLESRKVDVRRPNLRRAQGLCRSYKVFGLGALSTVHSSYDVILFSKIDSNSHQGYNLITGIFHHSWSEMDQSKSIDPLSDMVVYVFCYDSAGDLKFVTRNDVEE
jgi:hypothetical protein